MTLPARDYAQLAQDELDRADAWANKDSVEKDTRERFVSRFMQRAQVYALLSISQELNRLPANMPDYVAYHPQDD